jgi:metal-responsive CopG/Arc/MetJ family transcriptional regulator
MQNARKIAISLPADLVSQVEKIRKKTGESRSALIRRSIEFTLNQKTKDSLTARYIEGYQNHPETSEETNIARVTSAKSLSEEPWE